MINVTKPFIPPFEEVNKYLLQVWNRGWFTNNGPLVNELELKLKEFLDLDHLLYLNNGTIALQIAIKALDLKGEIITTPFSYVATTSSIVWEGCIPVFADIDPATLNIDPKKIEPLINENTSGILATHVYGNACDVEEIESLAIKHKLKVIYDGAHCFGTRFKGKSLFEFGDISTTSFHTTKLFHTVEGGAVFTKDRELLKKMSYLRNFGHNGPEVFECIGINGKNSELHAAVGMVNIKYVNDILIQRRKLFEHYIQRLKNFQYQTIKIQKGTDFNYSYFPVILKSETFLIKLIADLNNNAIFPRRYFYPSLSQLNYVSKCETPVSDDISSRVLCLPLYHDLTCEEIDFITRIMLRTQNN